MKERDYPQTLPAGWLALFGVIIDTAKYYIRRKLVRHKSRRQILKN